MPARAFYILMHFFAVQSKTKTSDDQIKGFEENMNTQRLIFFSLFEQLLDIPVTLNKLNKLEIERILGVAVVA